MATTAVIERWNNIVYPSNGVIRLVGIAATRDHTSGFQDTVKVRVEFAPTDGVESIDKKVLSSVTSACAAKGIAVQKSGIFYPRIEKGV